MITLLYNLDTQTAGQQRLGRYIVDGMEGVYPSNYVELVVQDPETPAYDVATQKLQWSDYFADLQNLLWTRTITVVDKTPEEIAAYQKDQIKNQKELAYKTAISNGYQIPNTTICLAMGDADRATWGDFLTLLNELLSSNQITLTTPLAIADKDGGQHIFQVSEIKQTLAGLGLYYYQVWSAREF